jgi:hypothetical protein
MHSGRSVRFKYLLAASICFTASIACAQTFTSPAQHAQNRKIAAESVCGDTRMNPAALAALRLVCQRVSTVSPDSSFTSNRVIVVGFVGGFVKADDSRHPEILFASYLREHYGSEIEAKVFSNHDLADALSFVLEGLDVNHDGKISAAEKNDARIIIYGHSWGASETSVFASELGRLEIPVLLTIQLDIIPKPGQKPALIPRNVASAINFYESEGPLRGKPTIVALDPMMTRILGNIQMKYDQSRVNCDNYNWFVRTFNKPHHEIENDAQVWNQVAALIDSDISQTGQFARSPGRIGIGGQEESRPGASGQQLAPNPNANIEQDLRTP